MTKVKEEEEEEEEETFFIFKEHKKILGVEEGT